MAVRDEKYWYKAQFKADLVKVDFEGDLGLNGVLDEHIEERSRLKLVVVGPLLDGYINQMASCFVKRAR